MYFPPHPTCGSQAHFTYVSLQAASDQLHFSQFLQRFHNFHFLKCISSVMGDVVTRLTKKTNERLLEK